MSDYTFSTIPVYVQSASVWLEIPVTSTTPPGEEATSFEVTSTKSGNYRQFAVSPLRDTGTLDFSFNYVPSDTVFKYLASRVGVESIWKNKFSDGTEWTFTGSLMKFAPAAGKVGEILTADASVKASGAVSSSVVV